MDYKDLVKDFATRTKTNLSLVRTAANKGEKAYEVTQLINSMLGLLVFPEQEFFNQIPEISLVELEKEGWPTPRICDGYDQVSNLKQLSCYMRNGIAHCNLRFTVSNGQIDGIIIWNEKPKGTKTWEAELKIDELESFTERLMQKIIRGYVNEV